MNINFLSIFNKFTTIVFNSEIKLKIKIFLFILKIIFIYFEIP